MEKFIVVETGYEYNDEGYSLTEGYQVNTIFDTLEAANTLCKKLTLNWLRTSNLPDYHYGEWCNNEDEFYKLYNQFTGRDVNYENDEDYWEFRLSPILTDEQIIQLIPFIRIKPFYIVKANYVEA